MQEFPPKLGYLVTEMTVADILFSYRVYQQGWKVRGSNPGGGGRFFARVQTGPGAHLASCAMGTGSFLVVKRPGRSADHPTSYTAEARISRARPLLPL
jgi:hypothetical protein